MGRELWHLRAPGSSTSLTWFLAGAVWDALTERRQSWKGESLRQDVRFAFRTLRKSPGFSAAALLTLALSIGASTALFSVIESALLSDPPYPEPDRLVVVDMLFGMEEEEPSPSQWSYPRYEALRDDTGSLEQFAGYGSRTMTLTDLGDPAVISVEVATPSLFPLLGVTTVRGRVFGPDEEDDGSADMVALVSHSFWDTRMGRSEDVVGTMITLDQLRFRVLGVLSEEFSGMGGVSDVWIPFSALREVGDPSMLEDPWNQHFHVVARLGLGVSLEQAQSEVRAFGETVMERFPPPAPGARLQSSADVLSLAEARRNPAATTSMLALFAGVLLLLLIATANLAALFLARGAARLKETALRASLGAARIRLFRQLLTESVIIALVGGLLGVGLAWTGMDVLGVWLTDTLGTEGGRGLQFVDADALSVNWRVLAFAFALTGGVGIAFGLLPAWQVSGTDPGDLLKGSRSVTGLRARAKGLGGRNALIVAQVALALVLLSAASLMLRTMVNLQRVDLGFDPANLLTAVYTLSPSDEQAGIDPVTFHVEFADRLRALPGVREATLGEVPMGGPTRRTIVLESEGLPSLRPEDHFWIRVQPVTENHLDVLGASLLDGRGHRADGRLGHGRGDRAQPHGGGRTVSRRERTGEGHPTGMAGAFRYRTHCGGDHGRHPIRGARRSPGASRIRATTSGTAVADRDPVAHSR